MAILQGWPSCILDSLEQDTQHSSLRTMAAWPFPIWLLVVSAPLPEMSKSLEF